MEHTISIWSNLKERDEKGSSRFAIEGRVTLTQEDIERLALAQYLEEHEISIDELREYKAELEETKH